MGQLNGQSSAEDIIEWVKYVQKDHCLSTFQILIDLANVLAYFAEELMHE